MSNTTLEEDHEHVVLAQLVNRVAAGDVAGAVGPAERELAGELGGEERASARRKSGKGGTR